MTNRLLLSVGRRDHRPRADLHADGSVTFVRFARGVAPPIGTTHLPVETVREAHACAVRLLRAEIPEMGAAHDPTQSLSLQVHEGDAVRGREFCWGRASRNDAYLEPVVGDAALADFGRLLDLLSPLSVRPDSVPLEAWLDAPAAPPARALDPLEEVAVIMARIEQMTSELAQYDDE